MDSNSYDNIANEYRDSKQLDFRKYIEEYTLHQLLGEVTGLNILDLACGEGIYTRKLKKRGAATILGVDVSARMIELAQEAEAKAPLGCDYLVQDALTMKLGRQFDAVVGMYLLNYAQSADDLQQFCQVVYEHLPPSGQFVGFNDNPHNQLHHYLNYRKYGFIKESTSQRNEGEFVRYRMFNLDGTEFSFNNFYFHPSTYELAFAKAGFRDFQWQGPFLDSSQASSDYWHEFMTNPPLIGFRAVK